MEKVTNIMASVLEMIDAGFSSKARQKEALEQVSHAWHMVRDEVLSQNYGGETNFVWEMPLDLHHCTTKKMDALRAFEGIQGFDHFEFWVSQLRDLREAVKAVPVVKQAPKNQKVAEVYQNVIDRIKQHDDLVDVADIFGGLQVSATPHSVFRDGKWFLRVFFYVNGKLTPLATIIAAAETIKAKKA